MYLVSCLIPIFKTERYIERCARSLFSQTYSNLEFIFVDDCSPDKSIDVLESVLNDYPVRRAQVKIIHHSSNKGLASARNTLLNNAEGQFICHVDSDDWLEPQAVELLVEQQIKTSADIVSGNAYMHTDKGIERLCEPSYHDKQEMVLRQFQYSLDHVVWRRLIRRSLYTDNHIRCLDGFDMTEDKYQMALLSYYAASFSRIDSYIYNYERRNESSIMSQYVKKETILRKQYESLGNWMGIYRFFYDKESVFHNESAKQTILYANTYLQKSLRLGSKQDFLHAIDSIDHIDADFWSIIGWSRKGFRGFLLHSYRYRRAIDFRDRVSRFLKREFKR